MLKDPPHMIDPTNYCVPLIPFGQITPSGHKVNYVLMISVINLHLLQSYSMQLMFSKASQELLCKLQDRDDDDDDNDVDDDGGVDFRV